MEPIEVVVVQFENLEEISHGLIRILLAISNIRVLPAVERLSQASVGAETAVLELLVGLINCELPLIVELAKDGIDELLNLNVSISILIEGLEKSLDVLFFQVKLEIGHGTLKFLELKNAVSIEVVSMEQSL